MKAPLTLALVVTAFGCAPRGPTKQAVDAENAAWGQYVAAAKELHQLFHACDAERETYQKASDASHVALMSSSTLSAAYHQLEVEKDKAEAYVDACERRQADYIETEKDKARFGRTSNATVQARSDKLRKVGDAWLDACVECAAGRACVQRMREIVRMDDKARPNYNAPPVCGK
jgi:hypothetical protein